MSTTSEAFYEEIKNKIKQCGYEFNKLTVIEKLIDKIESRQNGTEEHKIKCAIIWNIKLKIGYNQQDYYNFVYELAQKEKCVNNNQNNEDNNNTNKNCIVWFKNDDYLELKLESRRSFWHWVLFKQRVIPIELK